MNRKDVILEQFLLTHNKNGWFVSFQSAAAGLTDVQALWKERGSSNSILEIVSHLVFWNERYLNRFKEIPIREMEGENDSTFTHVLDWSEAVERFNAVMIDWHNAVRECEDAKLDQPVNPDSTHPWIETLTSITLHNAHHIGQIVTLRKMQGSWDREQGVS